MRFIRLREVANLLDATPATLRKEIHAGKLRAIRVGEKDFRISEKDLKEYIDRSREIACAK